jgi:sec-independent protein translocase protein TatA
MGLSATHILLVLTVAFLLFGRGKISELMGDVAKGIKSFKKGIAESEDAEQAMLPLVVESEASPRERAKAR